ncbi:hypothetical protein I4U23_022099 [Adineta vaga]|nr:hypothetical protein I4U23_022099 [Adineta vaga]
MALLPYPPSAMALTVDRQLSTVVITDLNGNYRLDIIAISVFNKTLNNLLNSC